MSRTDTGEAVLARQAALQAEAAAVLDDLAVLSLAGAVGRPVRVGGSALGLMVARDIDVTTLCPRLEPAMVFDAMRPLVAHPRIRGLSFRKDTGRWNTDPRYPDGLYWRVDYATDEGVEWNLDLWFIHENATQFDLEHMKTLPHRLTGESRVAILRIKEAVAREAVADAPPDADRVRSYEVYEAVLDHGVRTAKEFRRHRAGHASP
ncbi:MAG: hypothetical protein M3082_11690 [Candidatus Dormibacteraeota bacterium]|nr:hypothetical protein [Candidatus Dormibacteraeota bacterium]